MIGSPPSYFWMICWRYIGPVAMCGIFIASLVEIADKGTVYKAWDAYQVCYKVFQI